MSRAAEARGAVTWRDAAVCFAVALAVFVALGQSTIYGDGFVFLLGTRFGPYDQPNHPGYLPLMWWFRHAIEPIGLSQYESDRLFSQIGTAVGAMFLLCAFGRTGLERSKAWLATGLVVLAPSVVFYATVVEVHGPFFGAMGAAFLAATWVVHRCSWPSGLAAGVVCGLTPLVHAAGQLLVVPLIAFVILASTGPSSGASVRRFAVPLLAMTAAHGAVFFGTNWLVQVAGVQTTATAAAEFGVYGASISLTHPNAVFGSVWREWIWPFLPVSLAWLVGIRRPHLGWLVVAAVVVLYSLASFVILGQHPEFGAYLPPCAVLAAWLAARWLGRRRLSALVVLAVVLSVAHVVSIERENGSAAYVAGLREIADGNDVFLLAVDLESDVEAVFVGDPGIEYVYIAEGAFVSATFVESALEALDAHVDALRADGTVVFLSRAGFRWLEQPATHALLPATKRLEQYLAEENELRPVRARGFDGFVVGAR